jgi:hypothetical protein
MTLNFMGYLKLEEDPARIASQTQGPLRETLLRPKIPVSKSGYTKLKQVLGI